MRIRAFFLHTQKRKPFQVVQTKEMPVKIIKEDPLIFVWDIQKINKYNYYLPKSSPFSYTGILEIRKDIQLTIHDAYWAAIDRPGSVYTHVRLWIDENGTPIYEAHWVDRPKTYGEFTPLEIELI